MLRFLQDVALSVSEFVRPNSGGSSSSAADMSSSDTRADYSDKYNKPGLRGAGYNISYGSDTWDKIHATQKQAHRLLVESHNFDEFRTLLQNSSHVSEVINIRDMLGYNLLQYAVINNKVKVVQYLVKQGADLNLPVCARPLHLANKLGHLRIVQVLLEFGADPDVMSCVCYPDSHILQRTMFISDSECWSVACYGDIYGPDKGHRVQFEYPLYYAIMSDSLECVKLLINNKATRLCSSGHRLHIACQFGARRCCQYFLQEDLSELQTEDHKGLFPLQYAVQWGRKLTEFLVLNGALVSVKTPDRESLLLLLYKQDVFVSGLAESTSYLLDCGLSLLVNVVDSAGHSPLVMLFRKLHRNIPQWTRTYSPVPGDRIAMSTAAVPDYHHIALSEEEQEYLDTLLLLLRAGSNTNLVTKLGKTCLHELARVRYSEKSTGEQQEPRHVSFRLMYCLLCVLLKHGANPSYVNNSRASMEGTLVTSAVDILFQERLYPLAADDLELRHLLMCIRLLHRHGCNFSSGCVTAPLSHTLSKLSSLSHLGSLHIPQTEKSAAAAMFATQVLDVAEAVLESGAAPPDIQSVYYQLMTHHPAVPLSIVTRAVLLLLHHGADPNLGGIHVPMSVFRSRGDSDSWPVYPLLHLLNLMATQASVTDSTTVNDTSVTDNPNDTPISHGGTNSQDTISHNTTSSESIILSHDTTSSLTPASTTYQQLSDLFDILYNSMEENSAKQCMFHFLCYDAHQTQPRVVNKTLMHQVQVVMATPKSLRQITAQTVFVKLCQRQKTKVETLPLPTPLKKLLLSLRY